MRLDGSFLRFGRLAVPFMALLLASPATQAGSATWQLAPVGNDWNSASNWMPNTVPNGPSDVATFEVSNQTGVSITAPTRISQLVFGSGASAFKITAEPTSQGLAETLILSGAGISNESGLLQNFVATTLTGSTFIGRIAFENSATAGDGTAFSVQGSRQELGYGTSISFSDTSRAGSASFAIEGGTQQNSPGGR